MKKVYRGDRLKPEEKTVSDVRVWVILEDGSEYDLTPEASLKVYNHSPTGFSWGYQGSGPAQLALAILLDYYVDEAKALAYYQRFKSLFIHNWGDRWKLSSDRIEDAIRMFAKKDLKTAQN